MKDYEVPWSDNMSGSITDRGVQPKPRRWEVTMRVGGLFQATGEPSVAEDTYGFAWLQIGDSRFAINDVVVYQPGDHLAP